MLDFIKINPEDNVMVALKETNGIPAGHKRAITDIKKGEPIIKYGNPIGYATEDIKADEWVHTHNLKTGLGDILEYNYKPSFKALESKEPGTFKGYRRPDGKAGIRNEIWILPTVGCVNDIAKMVQKEAQQYVSHKVDAISYFAHPYGCSQLGDDHLNTQKVLTGLAKHPNAAGVLVMGLGCENNTIEQFKQMLGAYDENRVKFVICQDEKDEVSVSLEKIKELADYASTFEREDIPTSELIVGLKCGGSDGLSGITANPLVGVFSDRLISEGGSTILTEVPEMFGAETLLMDRCTTKEVFDQTVELINDFKNYFIRYNQEIYENPSPGNKKGGISTLEDKSLGCTQKGGTAPVVSVLKYGEMTKVQGLNLLQSPGNDLVAATALATSGAHIVLFTTGRGTPFGCPVPTVKISTNTDLYERKSNWIDFNAGRLVEGMDMKDVADEFYDYLIKLASGEIQTKTEQNDIRDIAIFKDGVTL
ncbi:UxaA family hydrolase [Cellulosilyticum sp. I15G10I2]|uniref:UxaA family hydrolase n=1 Tax=Cellulosilyticum sp. I15G10I2 TaxID=1892843 RepID=UPI00085C2885|nr:altronate dehydratase family protein [Cellulosilyticum sp. I15G10I2]